MSATAIAATRIPDCDLDRYESNLASHRRLNKRLLATDLRLQEWAPWAKPRYQGLGYPSRTVTEKVNEGGILARKTLPYPPEWPVTVVETESHVAGLEFRQLAAICAFYFHLALPKEQRIEVYGRLARELARKRPHHPREVRSLGASVFEEDLDRARWTVKKGLNL